MEKQYTLNIKNMNKTAVEWLVEEFKDTILKEYGEGRFLELVEQAKEMEKEQIINAWKNGDAEFDKAADSLSELYYNETFKSE